MQEGWRRRPHAVSEGVETSGVVFQGIPTVRWHLKGPYAEVDLQRALDGTLCIQCWTPYPERLNAGSARRILRQMRPFGRSDEEAKELITKGCCGVCGAEVSPEMARVFFDGYAPPVVQRSAPGDKQPKRDFEHLITDGLST